ncbi:neprilysin-1-like [Haemaphysalis longicornis]
MQPLGAGDYGDRPERIHELTCNVNRPRVIVVAAVMVSFLISAFIAIGPQSTRVAYVKAHPACKSAECTALAQAISSSVNTRIAPCQNFYRFVCDGWIKTHPARENELRRLVMRELADEVAAAQKKALISTQVPARGQDAFQRLAYVYQACVRVEKNDPDGLRVLKEFFGFIGLEWPQVTRTRSLDVLMTTVKLSLQWDIPTLIYVTVKPSPYDRARLLIAVDRGTVLDKGQQMPRKAAIRKISSLIGDLFGDLGQPEKIEAAVLLCEKYIRDQANSVRKSARKRNVEFRRVLSFKELEAMTFVDEGTLWLDAVNAQLSAGHRLPPTDSLILEHPDHVVATARLMRKPELAQSLLYYLGWLLIQHLGPKAALSLRKATFLLDRQVQSSPDGVPPAELNLWRVCMRETEDLMPTAYSALYVQQHGAAADKPKFDVKAIVDHVLWVTTETVRRLRWMDEKTKAKTMTKLKKMRGLIAFPQWMRNGTLARGLESELPDLNEHYLATWLRIKESKSARLRRGLRERHQDDQTYHYRVSQVGIRYYHDENRLIVHPAVLSVPLYAYGGPVALNYGALGTLVARQVLQAFDREGCNYDESGNEDHWCSSEFREQLEKGMACYSDQWESTSARVPGMSAHNDTWSRLQLAADTEGLRASLRAYRLLVKNLGGDRYDEALAGLSYTPEQLFFLNRGLLFCANLNLRQLRESGREDMLAAHEYRCNVPLTNLQDFSKAFNCKPGDLMYARNKCAIW